MQHYTIRKELKQKNDVETETTLYQTPAHVSLSSVAAFADDVASRAKVC